MSTQSRRAALAAGLGLSFVLVATAGLQTVDANGDTRTLSFVHTHTGERATFTFKRDGRYDPDGLRQANQFLRDWRRNEVTNINPRLLDLVWEVYRETGATQPINLVSAYRSPATNNMLRSRSSGVARESQHTRGNAMDFHIPGVSAQMIRERGIVAQRGGVGYYPGSEGGFVHLDVGSVRAWPRMTRDQLARLFPNGQTVHLPSDGRPLGGYDVARARLGRGGSGESVVAWANGNDGSPASGAGGGGTNVIARLFGFGGEPTPATPAPSGRSRAPATQVAAVARPAAPAVEEQAARTPAATQVATATIRVPLPPARPADLAPAAAPAADEEEADEIVTASIPLPPERPSDLPLGEAPAAASFALASAARGDLPASLAPLRLPAGADALGETVALAARATPEAPARPRDVQLVALDLSDAALRPFVTAAPTRQRSLIRPAVLSADQVSLVETDATRGFGGWRTGRTDSFAGPAVRQIRASL